MMGVQEVIRKEKPTIVLVHGDTTTTFAGALAAFYEQTPIGHVEAGLRTYQKYSPYPEEVNRQFVGVMADVHFAPTNLARENLIREGKRPEDILVTGNTAIDAIRMTVTEEYEDEITRWAAGSRLLVLTAHRRENLGDAMRHMFRAILRILEKYPDMKMVYPVHLNPQVRTVAKEIFGDFDRVKLIEPMDVVAFHNLLHKSFLILTDSGGIQEEAPSLGKPVIVLRNTTERPEGVEAGTLKLAGTDEERIFEIVDELIHNPHEYERMSLAPNPYGDGLASKRIANEIIRRYS